MNIVSGQPFVLELGEGAAIRFVWTASLGMWLGRTPLSRREFRCLEPAHGDAADGQPEVNVSWDDACRFMRRLRDRFGVHLPAGFGFRLPREAEWESAARCECVTEPVWGDRCPGFGNYDVIESSGIGRWSGSDDENAWGLCGMENGIWEWVEDVFDPTMNRRILRGACWYGRIDGMYQLLYHRTGTPDRGHPNFGFRVAVGPALVA